MDPEDRGPLCVRERQLQERYVGLESPWHDPAPISTNYVVRKVLRGHANTADNKLRIQFYFPSLLGVPLTVAMTRMSTLDVPLPQLLKDVFSHARPAPWRRNPSFILSFSLPPVAVSCWSKIKCFQRSFRQRCATTYCAQLDGMEMAPFDCQRLALPRCQQAQPQGMKAATGPTGEHLKRTAQGSTAGQDPGLLSPASRSS